MANSFLQIDKDLFKLGLNPTEILVLAQILEYDRTTGNCFISNEALAKQFGVSESTINRTIKALETKELIIKTTKNVKGGKERHMKPNKVKIQQQLTTSNLEVVDDDNKEQQVSNCLLTSSNLNIDKKQNDTIKENIKENSKEKFNDKPIEDGTIEHPWLIPKNILITKINELQTLANGLFMDNQRRFYKIKEEK